eukprot:PITA_09607
MKGVHPLVCTHHIYIKEDCKPVWQPQKRMNPALKDIVKEELQKLLDAGFIYPISDMEIYMDDFTPYGSNFQEALTNLGKVLTKCIEMNLSLSPEKCEFLMTEGTVLGHTISQQGLQVDPNKIAIIQKVPPPQKVRDVQSFLGLARFYRRFIKDFSKLALPLFGLLGKDVEFKWTDDYQRALDELKDKLVSAPILRGPNWALPFHSHTDASNKAIGAALGQVEEKLPYAIYFVSKNLSKAEMNYTVTEKEFLVVVHSLNKWLLLLRQFDLTIVDKLGKENVVADFLSRLDLPAGEEGIVDDQMLDEHMFSISVLSPWFADIANYLVSAQFPPHLSLKEKSKILTKWAETKAVKAVTEEKVAEFLRENIYKFGYPRELVTDRGSQFTSNLIEDLLAYHKIEHKTSTLYHPQANGQVEVTNRSLEEILTKVVSSSRKDWVDFLVEATWAYNTTWKTTTGFTPYELVYGKKALLSIEFDYNTLRVAAQLDLDLSHAQRERLLQLNELDEQRMQALLHSKVVQLQRNIWHDWHLNEKQFQLLSQNQTLEGCRPGRPQVTISNLL